MRPRIPEISRDEVIEKWLQANSRNKIAEECGLGKGTVTAIINEWSHSTGKDMAYQLRDFALALHNSGLSLTDCVKGFRVALCSKNLWIDIDDAEHFLAETYSACFSKGLEPRYVGKLLEDVISFSDGLNSISAMSDRLITMRDEKENLTNSIIKLEEKIRCLHAERTAAEELTDIALENDGVTQTSLKWHKDAKEELRKCGIPVDDILKFTKAVRWIGEQGYDAMEIVKTYSDYNAMKYATHNIQENLRILEKDISGLEENKATLERLIALHTQTLSKLQDLTRLGIGIKELRTIRSIIDEIAMANGLNTNDNSAWKKFFMDLEHQYDPKLGFERKIQDQRVQLRKLIFQVNSLSEHLEMLVADTFQTKIGEEQKLILANILNSHPDIAERVATLIEQRTLNKKKENTKTGRGSSPHDVVNGDIAGLEPRENGKQPSTDIFTPRNLTNNEVLSFSDGYVEQYFNYLREEMRMMASSSDSD